MTTAASNALIGWPIYSDTGVRLTPTFNGGSWLAGLPLTNLQAPELYKVARSSSAALADTRFRCDLKEDKSVRCIAVPKHTGSSAARFRFLGVPSTMLFNYEAGDDVAAVGGTFTRSGNAWYVDSQGAYQVAGTNVPRDGHFIGGVRHILLEDARTNLVIQSDALTAANGWTLNGTVLTTPAYASVGVLPLTRVTVVTGGPLTRAVTLTGNAVKAFSIVVEWDGVAGTTTHGLNDVTAGVFRALGTVTWAANGTATCVANNGTLLAFTRLRSGTYRIEMQSTTCTAANTNLIYATHSAGTATSVRVGGAQVENAPFPSSLIRTGAGTVTRNADALSFPYTPVPQAMTAYVDVVDLGSQELSNVGWIDIGVYTGGPGRSLIAIASSATVTSVAYNNDVVQANSSGVTGPLTGQRGEIRIALDTGTGLATLGVSVNGAAEVTSVTTPSATTPATWNAQTIKLNQYDGATVGFAAYRSVRIATGVQTLATMRAIVYDSGWFAPFPGGATTDDVEGMNIPVVAFPASTQTVMRYVSCQIDDALNTAGYVDVHRFCVTGGIQPGGVGMEPGLHIGLETATINTDSEGGATSSLRKPTRRTLGCQFNYAPDSEAFGQHFPFQRIAGTDRQFMFSYDPTDTTYLHHRTFLATLRQLSELEGIIGRQFHIPYAIREVL